MKQYFLVVVVATFFASQYYVNAQDLRHPAEPEMVFVEGGTFMMGCTEEQGSDCRNDERPAHSVTVSSFYIGKYPVTQGQWTAIMGTTISQQRDLAGVNQAIRGESDNHPMYYVSWEETQEFVRRLNDSTGMNYRLPTEAEWEFAARGGTQSRGFKYSGSSIMTNAGWFNNNSGSGTHPVGTKQPNELGIHDMSGNVWEWCSDRYGAYSETPKSDPTGATVGTRRVMRGGSWGSPASQCRITYRNNFPPGTRNSNDGFRMALSHVCEIEEQDNSELVNCLK